MGQLKRWLIRKDEQPAQPTDIVDRLLRWTHDAKAQPASDLMEEAADEIMRLRKMLSK